MPAARRPGRRPDGTALGLYPVGVTDADEPSLGVDAGQRAACRFCGRPTFDPDKRERPWARGAEGGRQVLVCPRCQEERPDWAGVLDRCRACDATRLSVMLGETVCRACGEVQSRSDEEAAGRRGSGA
jgi:hypothetical protein